MLKSHAHCLWQRMTQKSYLPPNCPGNMRTTLNNCDWSLIILRAMPLVLVSRPGPNIANFGVFLGQIERNSSDNRWKPTFCCFEIWATSGEHRRYLQIISGDSTENTDCNHKWWSLVYRQFKNPSSGTNCSDKIVCSRSCSAEALT